MVAVAEANFLHRCFRCCCSRSPISKKGVSNHALENCGSCLVLGFSLKALRSNDSVAGRVCSDNPYYYSSFQDLGSCSKNHDFHDLREGGSSEIVVVVT